MVESANKGAHELSFNTIDGQPMPLSQFAGKPVLVVNTASRCGFTPQYQDLQKLSEQYKDKGLTVIGVPSNDFGGQEPGTDQEIKTFCETSYGVDFPLAAKEKAVGEDAHPFFQWVAKEGGEAASPRWNFHKYLIAPDGKLAGAWPSKVKPLDRLITESIDGLIHAADKTEDK